MVDIIIVNWNSDTYLMKCIDSIFNDLNNSIINQVILIDNNSTDFSLNSIDYHEKILIIKNSVNLGFSKACNQGFALCRAPYVLLLNPDTILFDNTLISCIDCMDKNMDVEILGCRLLSEDGETTASCSRFPSPINILFDATGLSKIMPRIFTPATVMTDWSHNVSRYVDQVMGAFMLIRKTTLEKLGYFDERFFVYYEELDFSKRLAAIGGKTYYNHSITAIHSGEGTTRSIKGIRLFLNLKSRLLYSKKYFSTSGFFLVWCSTFLIEPFARIFFALIQGRFQETKEIMKGFWMLIKDK